MSIDQSLIRTFKIGETLHDILRSWMKEWVRLVRQAIPKLLPDVPLTIVEFSASEIIVRPASSLAQGRISKLETAGSTSYLSVLREYAAPALTVALRFPESEVLRPCIQLPRTKRTVVGKALYFELARVSPVPVDNVYYDYSLTSARADGSEVLARVRLIRRNTVDAAVAACHGAGLRVAAILFDDDLDEASWRSFPVDRPAVLLVLWQKLSMAAFAGLAVLLAILLLLAAYHRREAGLSGIDQQITLAQVDAAESARLRARFTHLAQAQSLLVAKKGKPLFARILSQISQTLPNDTWLTGLQVVGSKTRIQGYSRSASHLLSEIGDAGFSHVQFEAPLTRDGISKAERFDISFEARK